MSPMFRRRPPAEPLTLYTSENCGLCERARAVLAELGLAYTEVVVPDDHPYRLRTPVLGAGSRLVAEGKITPRSVRRGQRRPS